MKVVEYATLADPALVVEEYNREYEPKTPIDTGTVHQWAEYVRAAVGVNPEGMRAVVSLVGGELPAPGVKPEYHYSVGGADGEGKCWALDFEEWGRWRQMEVENATGRALSVHQLAAHLMWEMTWHGWPDRIAAKRAELEDTVEQFQRDLEDGSYGGKYNKFNALDYMSQEELDAAKAQLQSFKKPPE